MTAGTTEVTTFNRTGLASIHAQLEWCSDATLRSQIENILRYAAEARVNIA